MTTKKIKIIPRGKYMLVKQDPEESKTNTNGIHRPDNIEEEQKAFGTVEAVGPDIKDVKAGDRVMFGAFAGESIASKDNPKVVEYRLLHDDDVIAFLK